MGEKFTQPFMANDSAQCNGRNEIFAQKIICALYKNDALFAQSHDCVQMMHLAFPGSVFHGLLKVSQYRSTCGKPFLVKQNADLYCTDIVFKTSLKYLPAVEVQVKLSYQM